MGCASLPMYAFPALQAANDALWRRVRQGVRGAPERLQAADSVPDAISADTVFTQVCGFPLFQGWLGQGVLLGVPRYEFEGCEGASHRAAFVVRAGDPARSLAGLRGRVFGCNSPHSNTGMNLPRLSLARVADGRALFARVVFTGGHLASLQALAAGEIDVCSVDCVTWGLALRHWPERTRGLRVLDWTQASPCLPFVSSAATADVTVAALRRSLGGASEPGLGLLGVAAADPAAFAVLAAYQREAAALGYAVLA